MKTLRSQVLFLVAFLSIIAFTLVFSSVPSAQESDHIRGEGRNRDWSVDILDTSGTFSIDDKTWNVEFLQETGGLNGFSRTLSYFGREEENFIRLDIFIDNIGSDFLVFYFDYQTTELEFDRFNGDYRIGQLESEPQLIENYVPLGPIPDYEGPAFSIESEVADVTAEGGTVVYEGVEINVFPIKEVPVSPTWTEFWAVGIDPVECRSYYMQFYGSPNGWLFDLSTGEVFQVEFGGSEITGEVVEIDRNVNLEDLCVEPQD